MDLQPAQSSSAVPVSEAQTVPEPPPMKGGDKMHKPRNLILCFDGTANQFDGDVSIFVTLDIHAMLTTLRRYAEHERRQIIFAAQER